LFRGQGLSGARLLTLQGRRLGGACLGELLFGLDGVQSQRLWVVRAVLDYPDSKLEILLALGSLPLPLAQGGLQRSQ
jgi:hypothetical protein